MIQIDTRDECGVLIKRTTLSYYVDYLYVTKEEAVELLQMLKDKYEIKSTDTKGKPNPASYRC